jgi:hypothetical protein
LVRVGVGVAFLTTILLVLVVLAPSRRSLLVGIYMLVLAAIALGSLVGSFRTFEPQLGMRSPFERAPEKPEEPQLPGDLDRVGRLVVLGGANEFDLHYRLRPLLRQISAERLLDHYGVDLDRDPERARSLLGDKLWEVVRPDRQVGRRRGPGLPAAELAGDVARLEEL